MLETLQFVRGAVGQKSLEPSLKHFRIQDGLVQAYNGTLSLTSPIDCDLDVSPLADPFVRAIGLCEDTVSLHVTDTGRLAVKSGGFRAYIDATTDPFPELTPVGKDVELDGHLMEALVRLSPLMSDDASRPWARGILLAGQSAYATNNIVLAEHWLGYTMPVPMGLPAQCVNELCRIGEEPERVQSDGRQVTFHFSGDRRLTSAMLVIEQWPNPGQLLNQDHGTMHPIPGGFFESLEKLLPFADSLKRVYLNPDGSLTTVAADEEDGAHIQLPQATGFQGMYSIDQLLRLRGIVQSIDWANYPAPCAWHGEKARGVIVGLAG